MWTLFQVLLTLLWIITGNLYKNVVAWKRIVAATFIFTWFRVNKKIKITKFLETQLRKNKRNDQVSY